MSYTTGTGTAGDAPGGAAGGDLSGTYPSPALNALYKNGAWAPVRVATTANVTLSGTQTIDGVAVVAGDRVLVWKQTDAREQGIYDVAAGAWARSADADAGTDFICGKLVATSNDGTKYFSCLFGFGNPAPITLGVTGPLAFDFYAAGEAWTYDGSAASLGLNGYIFGAGRWLRNLGTPTDSTDAAPKGYVDLQGFQTLTTPPTTTTVYQNTTGRDLQASLKVTLAVNPVLASDCKVEISPDNFGSAVVWADPGFAAGAMAVGSDPEYIQFPIPIGWYYKVTSTNATIGALVAVG